MTVFSHVTPEVVDLIRQLAREQASRLHSEVGMRPRSVLQGITGTGGGWELDKFDIASTPVTVSNSGGFALLTFNEDDIRAGLIRKDAGAGAVESVTSYVGMATIWFTYSFTTPGTKPSPPNWSNELSLQFSDDYGTTVESERNFDHLSASSSETSDENFTVPIKTAIAQGISIQVTNSGTVWDFDITAGGVVFYGYDPNV